MRRPSFRLTRHSGTTAITSDTDRETAHPTNAVRALSVAALSVSLAVTSVATISGASATEAPARTAASTAPVTPLVLAPTASDSVSGSTATSARAVMGKVRERRAARLAIRQAVVDRALAQVGDSYAAGAEGPDAFDCSGFTLFAWRGAGVELTHYSHAQYGEVRPVNAKRAIPGDLVFYLSNGASHVGLYIGDGQIVHASDYGVGVIVSSVRGTAWTDAHFTGFGRVQIPEAEIEAMVLERRERPAEQA